MTRDQLFLLKRDFMDGARGPFYCTDCATLEGLLSFYPKLRDAVDVQYVDFPRPRAPVIAAVGPDNQVPLRTRRLRVWMSRKRRAAAFYRARATSVATSRAGTASANRINCRSAFRRDPHRSRLKALLQV